jgi:hypothetical protein
MAGRNKLGILRIKLRLYIVQNVEPDILPMSGGKRGRFAKVSFLYLALLFS